jgi:DamX protein
MARLQDHTMKNDFLDLQSRLEHLITYSSQLVFVSGDGMGKQGKFAQHFLSHQNELANIGYVDANTKFDIISYRKKFIQQLIGSVKVDYSKPLTFLIPRLLKAQSEFILIAVTHADRLPDEFLQELWDLVLQNRFAKNRHHLNILVFGEKEWASRAKSWLPANSNNKPVLLANEFVECSAPEPQNMSELDQLISTKRKQFNERLALRESEDEQTETILDQWWFKVVLSAVFLVTFTGILLSQYVTLDQAKSFYAAIFENQAVVVDSNTQHAEQAVIDSEISQTEDVTKQLSEESADDIPSFLTLADDQRRVVDWENAVKSLPKTPIELSHDNSEALNDFADSDLSEQPIETSILDLDTDNVDVEDTIDVAGADVDNIEADAFDYPVEDITSVEQLDSLNTENTQATALTDGTTLAEQSEESVIVDNQSLVSVVNDGEFDEAYLTSLDSAGFVLQLSAMSTEEALAFYLQTNQLTETTLVYKTQRFGGDWFVVLHDQTFESLQLANITAQELALSAPPFAKPISNVQQEIDIN